MMRLSHLSSIFSRLSLKTFDESDGAFHNSNHAEVFGKATLAAVELGLSEKAKPDNNADYNVIESVTNLENARSRLDGKIDLATTDLRECFTFLLNGVKLASELCDLEREELPKSPPPVKHLTFSRLMAVLGIKTAVKSSEESEIKSLIRPREE